MSAIRIPRHSGRRTALVGSALLVLLSGALALVAIQVAPRIAAPDAAYERITASGVLRVGMDASFPPFEYYGEAQQLAGFDVDIAHELARRMNLRAEFVLTGFDALYPELIAQHYDVIISALPHDRTRTRDVAYSDIYFRGGDVLLARSDDAAVNSVADLKGQRLGVELGTSGQTVARKFERQHGFNIQTFPSLEDASRALENGEVRAVVADTVSARLLRRAHPSLRVVGPPLGDEPNYVIALPLDAPTLLTVINKHLRAMEKDGTLARLVEKWF